MSDRLGLLLFWLIPLAIVLVAAVAIIHSGRKQKKDLQLWKESNQLLNDRIQQSTKRVEEIEGQLGDKR